MELSAFDELVWLEAIIKEASKRRDELKGECRDDLLEAYERDGTTQKRSKLFGKEASVMSVTFSKPKEPHEVVEWNNTDWDEFSAWLDENHGQFNNFLFQNYKGFCEWWFERTGEVPDGIDRDTHMTDPEPERVSGTRLSVKPEKVFERLGISFEDGMRGLLPGDVDE